ncbi:hypothetical protein [Blastopirellula marina]|uniref:hypothetical protein n=1 Tax=Blastopirellula marina TaxID=124 RepID=UPI0011B085F4|nr:hypothetical protein [Blastopirellula marina]
MIAGLAGAMLTGVPALVVHQAIVGSYIGSNFIGLSAKNANPSFLVDTTAYITAVGTEGDECDKTGCWLPSAYSSTASTRGLKTGSGVMTLLVADMIANPLEARLDCTKGGSATSNTGGTLIVTDLVGTGATATYQTAFVVGPTEGIRCKWSNGTNTGAQVRIKGLMMYSDVTS